VSVSYHIYTPTVWRVVQFSDNGNNRHQYYMYEALDSVYLSSEIYVGTTRYQEDCMVSVYTALGRDSLDTSAYIFGDEIHKTWLGKTMIIGDDGCWFRTHLVSEQLITEIDQDIFENILSPAQITNFTFIKPTNDMNPFDGKNYSVATRDNSMTYTLISTEDFDTVALGNVKADHVYIEFRDLDGIAVTTIDVDVNTSRDAHGHLEDWHTTLIYYSVDEAEENPTSTVVLPAGYTVLVTLTTTQSYEIELATLMLGMSAEAGFTNLQLKNSYKDFSTFDYDAWGGIDYVDKAKVSRYSGSVDMRIENYDMTDRLMTSLGQNLVILNGSDGLNKPTNSKTIFAATQKIGRFTAFDQKTMVTDADMDVMATYTFTLEEIVAFRLITFIVNLNDI